MYLLRIELDAVVDACIKHSLGNVNAVLHRLRDLFRNNTASLKIEALREYFSSGVSLDILTKRTQLVALWWGVEYKTDAIFTVVTACVMKSQLCSER